MGVYLQVQNNALAGQIPRTIAHMSALEVLDLSFNQVPIFVAWGLLQFEGYGDAAGRG